MLGDVLYPLHYYMTLRVLFVVSTFAFIIVVWKANILHVTDVTTTRYSRKVHATFQEIVIYEQNAVFQEGIAILKAKTYGYFSGKEQPNEALPYDDIKVTLPISAALAHLSDGKGNFEKYWIGNRYIAAQRPVVYSIGLGDGPLFDHTLQSLGAQVFSFDCTLNKSASWNFNFFPWCIGVGHFHSSVYRAAQELENHTSIYVLSCVEFVRGP